MVAHYYIHTHKPSNRQEEEGGGEGRERKKSLSMDDRYIYVDSFSLDNTTLWVKKKEEGKREGGGKKKKKKKGLHKMHMVGFDITTEMSNNPTSVNIPVASY